jgi:hypothetical protein
MGVIQVGKAGNYLRKGVARELLEGVEEFLKAYGSGIDHQRIGDSKPKRK